jgi:hypothetical protein
LTKRSSKRDRGANEKEGPAKIKIVESIEGTNYRSLAID